MTAVLLASFLTLALWIAACAAAADAWARFPRLTANTYPGPPDPAPKVTVLVPARNEEESIGACLETLAAQDYPNFEVVLIDDRSEDRTGEIGEALAARDARFRVLRGADLPPGWAGKCHALWQGVEATEGEYILMMDADAFARPRLLTQTVSDALDKKADLYTIDFEMTCITFWEKVVQPFMAMLILLGFPREKVNDPKEKAAIAPGPFLLFRREAYLAIGGHAAMKAEVVEDMKLAQRIKETGHTLWMASAPELFRTERRIGLKAIWHGWSRVFFTGVGGSVALAAAAFVGIAWFLLAPWILAPAALAHMGRHGWSDAWFALFALSAATCFAFLALRRLLWVFYRLDRDWAILQPVAAALALAMLVNSVIVGRFRKGGVVWRGRKYAGNADAP